jgi:uncharacterized protein YndB with AHSA1/START domain
MSYELKIEKVIKRPVPDVFRALQEGRLFMNCSANSNSMKIDFRVGGGYLIEFANFKKTNFGEFLEIIPNKKIVFTWCQSFEEKVPNTQVTIELFEDGSQTRLVLGHTGFKNKEVCDNHYSGWNSGLTDLAEEIQNGRIRMVRSFKAPVESLYEVCKNPESFFAFMGDLSKGKVDFKVGGQYQVPTQNGEVKGEFVEIVPNQKIKLTWLMGCSGPMQGSFVSLLLKQKDDTTSTLELLHDGLVSEKEQKAHRSGWDFVTSKMLETLNARH